MAGSPYVVDYRGSFLLGASPDEVWEAIEDRERFEGWWAWLREFRFDGPGLHDGTVLHGVVEPPVPYRMRVSVVLERCVRPSLIEATVLGDLEGRAQLTLEPYRAPAAASGSSGWSGSAAAAGSAGLARGGPARDQVTRAEVAWTIEMKQRAMRVAARVAHPLLRWGHDRVVDATVAGFRRHLAGDRDEARSRRRDGPGGSLS